MSRTLKENGRAMFSDESVAPWLRKDDLGKMIIENNSLYSAIAPIDLLPNSSSNVKLEWIVQNSFYKISFGKRFKSKDINPNVEHKSPRGGSMRKRYHGKIDGIDEKMKENRELFYSKYPINDRKKRHMSISAVGSSTILPIF